MSSQPAAAGSPGRWQGGTDASLGMGAREAVDVAGRHTARLEQRGRGGGCSKIEPAFGSRGPDPIPVLERPEAYEP